VSDQLYKNRPIVIRGIFIASALVLVLYALYLQVIDSQYARKAEATAIDKFTIYPSRGLIYDRNGVLLTVNNPVYDLWVTYNQVSSGMNIDKLCLLLDITPDEYRQRLEKDWSSVRFTKRKPYVFMSSISAETYATLQESLFEFPGFFMQTRNVRGYPHTLAAHALGYIKEVDQQEIDASQGAYVRGDYIGATGLEKTYEELLRGIKGARYVLKDNLGRVVGPYKEGNLDSIPVSGSNLVSSLDIELQLYAEQLMQNKIGSVVAIEPQTGEILCFLSSPSYNPSDMTITRERGKALARLVNDPLNPFFNRAVMARYSPGSTFKMIVALIAMQEGVLRPETGRPCPGFYSRGSGVWGCRAHPYPANVATAIQFSCNAYFFQAFSDIVEQAGFYKPEIGYEKFVQHLFRFGLGRPLGIDFPGETGGNVPTVAYYDRLYPKVRGGWKAPTIISLGIGQGELQLTTVQMANLAAIIANRGWYRTPHLVRGILEDNQLQLFAAYQDTIHAGIDEAYYQAIVDGMVAVVNAGTARAAAIPGIQIGGKTGTVQNPHGQDHSTFIAFAPVDNPKIAIAVYVENSGGGGRYAAPISSLLLEKYLKGSIDPSRQYIEDNMLNANLVGNP
jgi:penicillin-binding protein 2